MSVSATARVLLRRFNGYTDPRYPIAFWAARQAILGNGTGGEQEIRIEFASGTEAALNSNMYSLEQIGVLTSNNVDANGVIITRNMDPIIASLTNVENATHFQIEAVGTPSQGAAIAARDAGALRGMFLGGQDLLPQGTRIQIVTPNVDLSLFTVTVQGYVWGARSVLADGGPQRPPTGLYRN